MNDVSGHRAHFLTYVSTLNRLARHWLHLRHQNVPYVLPKTKKTIRTMLIASVATYFFKTTICRMFESSNEKTLENLYLRWKKEMLWSFSVICLIYCSQTQSNHPSEKQQIRIKKVDIFSPQRLWCLQPLHKTSIQCQSQGVGLWMW